MYQSKQEQWKHVSTAGKFKSKTFADIVQADIIQTYIVQADIVQSYIVQADIVQADIVQTQV